MKVLILGGTGAMGRHLVKFLSDAGVNTTVTSRKYRDSFNSIRYIQGNAHSIHFIEDVLSEKYNVIVDFMLYKTNEFRDRFTLLLQSTDQYIYISSSRVYDNSCQLISEESSRLLNSVNDHVFLESDDYALAKARQEDILQKSNFKNWTIVRPYITYSETRLQLGVLEKEQWLYRALKGRTIVFSSDIAYKYTTLTYGAVVANAIFKLIGNTTSYGSIFNVMSNQSYKWIDILDMYTSAIEKHTGKSPKILIVNKEPRLKYGMSKYQIIYDRLYDRRFNNTKIKQLIGELSYTDIVDDIDKCIQHIVSSNDFSNISPVDEAIRDRLTKEFTPLNTYKTIKHKIIYLLYRFFI